MKTFIRQITRKAFLIAFLAMSSTPILAQETTGAYEDCVQDMVAWCDRALEISSWWEKISVGIVCTGMIGGCGVVSPF